MALSGEHTGSKVGGFSTKITWSATQEINNNRSYVTAKVYLIIASGWSVSSSASKNGSTTINGSAESFTKVMGSLGAGTHLIATRSLYVSHGTDGTKSFSLSAYFDFNVTISGYGRVNRLSTGSKEYTLDTIPRASTISSISGSTIGSEITINFARASESFTHQVWYHLPNQGWQNLGTGYGDNCKFTIPVSESVYIPNSPDGNVTIAVQTKSGSTNIGAEIRTSHKVYVPSWVVPSFSGLTVYDENQFTRVDIGAYVKTKSKVKLTVVGATGSYGSTIQHYRITGGGANSYASTTTLNPINHHGTVTFKGMITDSRGRSAERTMTINVIDYDAPTINNLSILRTDSDGTRNTMGVGVTVKANVKVSEIVVNNIGKNKNFFSIKRKRADQFTYSLIYDEQGDWENWTHIETFAPPNPEDTNHFHFHSTEFAYDFIVEAYDVFGTTITMAGSIPTGVVLQQWGRDTTSFGKMIDTTDYNVLVGSKGLLSDGRIGSKAGFLAFDKRNENLKPSEYGGQAVHFEFKLRSAIDDPPVSTSAALYVYVMTFAGWIKGDSSGGWPIQLAFGKQGLASRYGVNAITWSSWSMV